MRKNDPVRKYLAKIGSAGGKKAAKVLGPAGRSDRARKAGIASAKKRAEESE